MKNTTPMHPFVTSKLNFVDPPEGVTPRVTYPGNSAPQRYNEAYEMKDVAINNARISNKDFRLHEHGFEMADLNPITTDFDDEESIMSNYYQNVIDTVKKVSGATHVFVFDHTVRRGFANSVRKPAQHVHVDYTKNTGPSRAAEMIDSDELKTLQGKRFIQVNVWRSINGLVEEMPLAFLDSQSLDEKDLVPTEIAFKDKKRLGEIYALKHNAKQQWYYYPEMNSSEALLIKGYDTDQNAISHFTPHSAFEDPLSKHNAKPRQSIEVRTFAFFD
jgi:hypothetical protein